LIAGGVVPDDPDDPRWAHLLVEAARAAGHDRPAVLHEHADGGALVEAIRRRSASIDADRAGSFGVPTLDGDTTYLCSAGHGPDGRRMAVSLIQSNASGFGSHLVEPRTGINLHNRGLGFNLVSGHPAELRPGRRPPHTLSPAIATSGPDLAAVLGTMGGDAQPQILLQLAVRLFHHRQSPQRAVDAGRFVLRGPSTGFDTWATAAPLVLVEGHASPAWVDGLRERGHVVELGPPWDSGFGHAHAITVDRDEMYAGAADPRARIGSVAGA
jgi:gamma-glutamyltranspeptidase/glutathione hydrolase